MNAVPIQLCGMVGVCLDVCVEPTFCVLSVRVKVKYSNLLCVCAWLEQKNMTGCVEGTPNQIKGAILQWMGTDPPECWLWDEFVKSQH